MSVVKRTTITLDALRRLTPKWWGKPRIASLLMSWADEIQELEDAIFQVIDSRLIDNAVGYQLKILGRIVGQNNFGWDDVSYRAAIRARIRASRSNGTYRDIIEVARLLTSAPVTVRPGGNASVVIRWSSPTGVIDPALRDILQDTRRAGVKIIAIAAQGAYHFTYRHAGATSDPNLGYDEAATHGFDQGGSYSHVQVI